jgi:hypothetical protein
MRSPVLLLIVLAMSGSLFCSGDLLNFASVS